MPFIYECKCECGCSIELKHAELDKDNDLTLTVGKCPDCHEEAFNEGAHKEKEKNL